jgi:hypothetical protein
LSCRIRRWSVAFAVAISFWVAYAFFFRHGAIGAIPQWSAAFHQGAPQQQQEAPTYVPVRKVLRFSVIPGGVSSVRDLREKSWVDPDLKLLLQGFDWDNARVTTLSEPKCFFSTFRKPGDSIHWTKTASLCLPAGERVITDGKIMVRMACGNIISILPGLPVDPDVNGSDLDLVDPRLTPLTPATPPTMVPPVRINDIESSSIFPSTPATRGRSSAAPAFFLPTICCLEGYTPPPPVSVPEPSALEMLLAACVGFLFVLLGHRLAGGQPTLPTQQIADVACFDAQMKKSNQSHITQGTSWRLWRR